MSDGLFVFRKIWIFLETRVFWSHWGTGEGNVAVGGNLEIKAWKGAAALWKIFYMWNWKFKLFVMLAKTDESHDGRSCLRALGSQDWLPASTLLAYEIFLIRTEVEISFLLPHVFMLCNRSHARSLSYIPG